VGRQEEGRPRGGAEAVDQFDRLNDAVLLDVLNCIGDIKTLGCCALVSRRLHALVSLIRADCVIPDDTTPSAPGSSYGW